MLVVCENTSALLIKDIAAPVNYGIDGADLLMKQAVSRSKWAVGLQLFVRTTEFN